MPTIVQLALSQWPTPEADGNKADRDNAFTTTCAVADLETAIALAAAELDTRHKLVSVDAIYATPLSHEADLLP